MNYCIECKHLKWGDTCAVTAIPKLDPITKVEVLTNVEVGQVRISRQKWIESKSLGAKVDSYSAPCPYFKGK